MSSAAPASRHVHFPSDLASGSHRPPVAFRRTQPSLINSASNAIRDTANQIQSFVHSASVNTQAALYGLRQEVPFERWFYHYGLDQNSSDASLLDHIKVRAWAIASFSESLLRATIELIALLFSKIFDPESSSHHQEVLAAQGTSMMMSLNAVIFWENAVEEAKKADASGAPAIGSLLSNWHWGTPYYGTLTIPITHLECCQYNWAQI